MTPDSLVFIVLPCGEYGTVVRWVPALIVARGQIDEAARTFTQALDCSISNRSPT
jgi:4-aminobutyrate aminotransferase-like enzyme